MNRRVVLIDQEETPNYVGYFAAGLGKEIYTLQYIESLDYREKKDLLTFGETDAIMLVGAKPFDYLKEYYHFGIRGENYFDCSKLYRLSIEGGAFVKEVIDFPDKETIANFMSEDFVKPRDFSWFKQKVIHTYDNAMKFLDYMDSLPLDTDYGYDYEASGMPLDKWFELSGAALCTIDFGGFISFTDIRHETGGNESEQYRNLLNRLGNFLIKRMNHVWTYNMQYEFQVSHRMLGVDLYNLCDASVVNVLDGYHLKKYSLKWTAQRILGVNVWDTEFDRISELIDSMLFVEEGKLKKDKHKVLKVTQETYKNTDEWKELIQKYPNYEKEFEQLMIEYWGNPFMIIPSDILGYYCNKDAFYTLLIYKTKQNEYSEEAWGTFLDNTRLFARLHAGGLYIDEKFRQQYHDECLRMEAWGITYCAEARCKIKMNKHQPKMANIEKYNPTVIKLLRSNKFHSGELELIARDLLVDHIDRMNIFDLGIDEGALLLKYGEEFANKFIELTRNAMEECGMIKLDRKTGIKSVKLKIDDGIITKKKILSIIGSGLVEILCLEKFKYGDVEVGTTAATRKIKHLIVDKKHQELEKYLYYERLYKELMKISATQLTDINKIPDSIYAFGKRMNLQEYSDYIADNIFRCKSPIEDVEICREFAELYRSESAYLSAIFSSIQQLDGAEKYYENLGITTVEDAFNHFMLEWKKYHEGTPVEETAYPEKMYTLAYEFYNNLDHELVRATWNSFDGFEAQDKFFKYVDGEFEKYAEPFSDEDLQVNNFYFMRKFTINYLLYKKYSKVQSTYIDGMFKANNKYVIEGADHIPLREADPNEPGAIEKCFVHYEVNTKNSKRCSSGFHTIIAHADLKDCITTPPAFDLNGNIIYGGGDFFETYFDISSAEVKAAGYASGDPKLIAKFEAGEDIYIFSAKLYLGEEHWDELDKAAKKMWRKRFKTIFLGVLYGLGKTSLAEKLNCSVPEAEDIIQGLYKSFPRLREYVKEQQEYPLQHNGYINTMLGDKLQLVEWGMKERAKTNGDKKSLEAAIKRKGVNFPIQGGTSSIMARGFMNNIRVSKEENWKNALQPIIVVH